MFATPLCFLCAAALSAPAAVTATANFSVVGYLPEWRYGGANFDQLFRHLTHLLFFSVEPTPTGSLTGLDRLPGADVLADAKAAAAVHGTKLLLCMGGNGRSSGFGPATRSAKARKRLVAKVAALVRKLGLDGVDVNWEYPGFTFKGGYSADAAEVADEWDGLAAFVRDLKAAPGIEVVTLAYYPDGRQERELRSRGLDEAADLMHSMAYDAPGGGGQHSPISLAERTLAQAREAGLRPAAVTLGLPFYGRHSQTGDWVTYEDILGRHLSSKAGAEAAADDSVAVPGGGALGYNGPRTIARKVRLALEAGLGGVMIWESGQDCRVAPVTRGGQTHVRTCPAPGGAGGAGAGGEDEDDSASLHAAISRAVREWQRMQSTLTPTATAAAAAAVGAVAPDEL